LVGARPRRSEAILNLSRGHAVARSEARHPELRRGSRRPGPSRCRGQSDGNLGEGARNAGATFAIGRHASGRHRLAIELATLARERIAQGGAGRLLRLLRSAAESADDIVGYVFAINGKITGGDVYGSSALFRKMWRKLLIANITQAISEKNGARISPPSLDDVQAFLRAADSIPPSERALNTGVRLATGGGDTYVSTGIKRVRWRLGAPQLSGQVTAVPSRICPARPENAYEPRHVFISERRAVVRRRWQAYLFVNRNEHWGANRKCPIYL
jgi:hypothetical protein